MKVYFTNKDGLKLVGVLSQLKNKTSKCIILCHGATVDKDEGGVFKELTSQLTDAGFAVFRFDFRGHGESESNSTEMTVKGEKQDLEAALDFLLIKNYKQFGIVAASFGGGAVSYFVPSHQDKVKALIYWNSVLEFDSLLKRWLSKSEKERLRKYGFIVRDKTKYGKKLIDEISKIKPWKELHKLRIPVLFIHGDKDSHVPFSDSVRFAKMINAKLEVLHGSEHGFHTEKYSKQASKAATNFFLKELV